MKTIYIAAAIIIGILAMLVLSEPDLTKCEQRYSKQTCEHYAG